MPDYAWTCHVCGSSVAAGMENCARCQAPSVLSPNAIVDLKRKRSGLEAVDRRWNVKRTAFAFLGAYLAVIALCIVFVATASGDMAGLVLVVPALPWPILAERLLGSVGFGFGLLGGLALNAVLAFYAGVLAAGYATVEARERPKALSSFSARAPSTTAPPNNVPEVGVSPAPSHAQIGPSRTSSRPSNAISGASSARLATTSIRHGTPSWKMPRNPSNAMSCGVA